MYLLAAMFGGGERGGGRASERGMVSMTCLAQAKELTALRDPWEDMVMALCERKRVQVNKVCACVRVWAGEENDNRARDRR